MREWEREGVEDKRKQEEAREEEEEGLEEITSTEQCVSSCTRKFLHVISVPATLPSSSPPSPLPLSVRPLLASSRWCAERVDGGAEVGVSVGVSQLAHPQAREDLKEKMSRKQRRKTRERGRERNVHLYDEKS